MNSVVLIGNLAADPELKQTPSNVSVCTFRLAVQRRYANSDGTRTADFIPVVCWRQTAELAARYLTKGKKCAVTGSMQVRSYDGQDGQKRYVTEVIADSVEFLSPAGNAERGYPEPPPERGAQEHAGFTEVDDDELPF